MGLGRFWKSTFSSSGISKSISAHPIKSFKEGSLSKNSTFKDYNFTTGSDLTKNQTKINLNEKNSNYIGSGVVISNSSKCENYLDIRHLSDSAKSDCSFKAVSRGKSNVSFNGKVFVDKKCFNTVSNQISKGLLKD